MKIVATADIHSQIPSLKYADGKNVGGDVLVIAGDLTGTYRNDLIGQAAFINSAFHRWTEYMKTRFNHILVIAGNHDVVWEKSPELIHKSSYYTYLQDESITIDGIKFWGCPWTKPFFDWGFNADDEKRQRIFQAIPEDVDVLIAHGPPRAGRVDVVKNRFNGYKEEFAGDYILLEQLKRIQPKHVFCGHLHQGYGNTVQIGDTVVHNCANIDEDYSQRPLGEGFVEVEI